MTGVTRRLPARGQTHCDSPPASDDVPPRTATDMAVATRRGSPMNRKAGTCIAAALAAGATLAAVAHAAKPMSAQEREARVAAIKANHQAFRQPRTMAEAAATEQRLRGGGVSVRVPTELWNQLSAERGATGELRIRESDHGVGAQPAQEASHE